MDALALPRRPGEHWVEEDAIHIEVRGLAPPGPFVAIIKLIASLTEPVPVIVHHDRDPVHLYAELAERGWLAERMDGEPGEFRLRLSRES
jgi:hypothetical protein